MLGAVYPEMDAMKLSVSLLDPIPFINIWFIPGLLLFCLNGIGSGWAAYICFRRNHGAAGRIAQIIGSMLFVWIIAQIIVIGVVEIMMAVFLINNRMEKHSTIYHPS